MCRCSAYLVRGRTADVRKAVQRFAAISFAAWSAILHKHDFQYVFPVKNADAFLLLISCLDQYIVSIGFDEIANSDQLVPAQNNGGISDRCRLACLNKNQIPPAEPAAVVAAKPHRKRRPRQFQKGWPAFTALCLRQPLVGSCGLSPASVSFQGFDEIPC